MQSKADYDNGSYSGDDMDMSDSDNSNDRQPPSSSAQSSSSLLITHSSPRLPITNSSSRLPITYSTTTATIKHSTTRLPPTTTTQLPSSTLPPSHSSPASLQAGNKNRCILNFHHLQPQNLVLGYKRSGHFDRLRRFLFDDFQNNVRFILIFLPHPSPIHS
jgi:hypothetical protein